MKYCFPLSQSLKENRKIYVMQKGKCLKKTGADTRTGSGGSKARTFKHYEYLLLLRDTLVKRSTESNIAEQSASCLSPTQGIFPQTSSSPIFSQMLHQNLKHFLKPAAQLIPVPQLLQILLQKEGELKERNLLKKGETKLI